MADSTIAAADRVTLFTEWEFNRTFQPHSNGGTDHAWGQLRQQPDTDFPVIFSVSARNISTVECNVEMYSMPVDIRAKICVLTALVWNPQVIRFPQVEL